MDQLQHIKTRLVVVYCLILHMHSDMHILSHHWFLLLRYDLPLSLQSLLNLALDKAKPLCRFTLRKRNTNVSMTQCDFTLTQQELSS